MLNESILGNEVFKVAHRNVMVVDAIVLAGSRRTSRMRDGEAERVGVLRKEAVVQGSFADA